MKNLTFLFIFFVTSRLIGANLQTIADGDWTNSSIWSTGHLPQNNDVITINHNVNLDISISMGIDITINAGASLSSLTSDLRIKNGKSLIIYGTLQVHDLQFDNGSTITTDATGSLEVENDFTNMNNSDNVTIDGTFNVHGNFDNGNGGAITGSGEICTTGSYTGAGNTFGYNPTTLIPAGSCVRMSVMPIELLSFNCEETGNNIIIKWETATETNNSHFELMRSLNGVDFEIITNMPGAGNCTERKSYSFTDINAPSQTIYYLLKQIDFNGKYEIFDMISINHLSLQSDCDLKIMPNPCIGKCTISFKDCQKENMQDAKFLIYDATGKVIYTSVNKVIEEGEANFSFDVSNNLKPAIYIVRGSTQDKVLDKKTILQPEN